MEHYQLTNRDCSRTVSDRHLDEISLFLCCDWRGLRPYLGMKSVSVEDIGHGDEVEQRYAFFFTWKHLKGFRATYWKLLWALFEVNSRVDAERVCEMLQSSPRLLTDSDEVI